MKTERMKSFMLFSLVILSFVMTTRIWFYISIEGLFVMPSRQVQSYQLLAAEDKEKLLKPNKLVVHMGVNHTLLFHNKQDQFHYSEVLKNANEIIKDLFENEGKYTASTQGLDKLQAIREGSAVELIFDPDTQSDYFKALLGIQKNLWKDVKGITSIIISPNYNKVYIIDQGKAVIHEFTASSISDGLENTIAEINAEEDFAVFLNDFNSKGEQIYGNYAVAPVSIVSMPILSIQKEVEADTKLNKDVAGLFNDEPDKISSLPAPDGTITFTDREEETINVFTNGAFEYYRFNVTSKDVKYVDMKEAIQIATEYVNQHFKLEGDFYLSEVESSMQGGRTSYIVRFDYRYNGIPVETAEYISKSAVEIEIIGDEVKRYRRNVRSVVGEDRTVNIKTFEEVLDIVQGKLNDRLMLTNQESIKQIDDLYLAYYEDERDDKLIPVWIADIEVESSVSDIKITSNKKYIIRADEGVIIGEK